MSAPSSNPDRPPAAVLRGPRPSDSHHDPELDQEAIELQRIQTQEDNQLDYSSPSASSGEEYRVTRRTSRREVRPPRPRRKGKSLWSKIAWFWTHHVTLTVPQKHNRDHLGMWTEILSLPDAIH